MIDDQWIKETVDALACRLDALVACCEKQASYLGALATRRSAAIGNRRQITVALPAATWTLLVRRDSRRQILVIGTLGGSDIDLSLAPSGTQQGFMVRTVNGPFVLYYSVYGCLVWEEWWCISTLVETAVIIEQEFGCLPTSAPPYDPVIFAGEPFSEVILEPEP